ncbi:hypothetical protein FDE98_07125 [Clostridium sporogenes]|uniref:TIGR02391 family protein n=1 Tax=Clostridium sporogenes TaxID=1509 RepID=A0A7X5P942_CLOSG|nr:hypothetical protein [Clostridium sporogenes]AJD31624.1 hypothetical protein T258_887 [Clostridium botulinum Prevot_594]NFQ16269.1 hypothetical protein [Clostridium sporogenes]NFQ20294.1 hypothetical protein [Clostridium sporogenes]NFQ27298.1 hypothetical protein [Clostridium sporogenes]NFR61407.1 hypothetical protein [Clostridium sporogenes]
MFNKIDSKEDIALFQLCSILKKYVHRIIDNNGFGEVLLRCSGLSSLIDDYAYYFNPHSFYRGYRNPNDNYNPEYGLLQVCIEIRSNNEALTLFLGEIFKRIKLIDEVDLENIRNYLGVFGYELISESGDIFYNDVYNYFLKHYTIGEADRQNDISLISSVLNSKHPEIFKIYNEAISTFGNGEFKSCIDNCRTVFEAFFKKLDVDNNVYNKGILNATGEKIIDNGANLESINKIFNYWLTNKKGANRYRLFITMYSMMSGLGTHGEDNPQKDDALMCLRMTEDVLIWCFHNKRGF